jgi:hypothetical protein
VLKLQGGAVFIVVGGLATQHRKRHGPLFADVVGHQVAGHAVKPGGRGLVADAVELFEQAHVCILRDVLSGCIILYETENIRENGDAKALNLALEELQAWRIA